MESALALLRTEPALRLRDGGLAPARTRGAQAGDRPPGRDRRRHAFRMTSRSSSSSMARAGSAKRSWCTASDELLAGQVMQHLGMFDAMVASDGDNEPLRCTKARALVERFGERGFDYAGNASGRSQGVGPRPQGNRGRRHVAGQGRRAADRGSHARAAAARRTEGMAQGAAPAPVDQEPADLPASAGCRTGCSTCAAIRPRSLALLCFGLCASARVRAQRPARPGGRPASPAQAPAALRGRRYRRCRGSCWPHSYGRCIRLGLWFGPIRFAKSCCATTSLTLAYSFKLKRVAMLDVVVLAALYTVRIIAGTVGLACRSVVLAARLLDVPLPQPGASSSATRELLRHAPGRQGLGQRPRLLRRGPRAAPCTGRLPAATSACWCWRSTSTAR